MDLFLERFDVAALVADIAAVVEPLAERNGNRLEVRCAPAPRADARRPHQGPPGAVQPPVERLQVHRAGTSPWPPGGKPGAGRRSDRVRGERHRHRDDGGAGRPALPGVHPGGRRRRAGATEAPGSGWRSRAGSAGSWAATSPSRAQPGTRQHVHRPPAGGSVRSPGRPRQPVDTGPAGRRLVLVIDDDPAVRELMARYLAREGFRVAVAAGGEEGLRLARELSPDAITLDVMMPGLDGWAVLERSRRTRRPPTSRSHADDRRRSEPRLRARRRRVPHQADRPRAAPRRAGPPPPRPPGAHRRGRPGDARAAPPHAGARRIQGRGGRNGRVALDGLRARHTGRHPARPDDAGDGRLRVPRGAPGRGGVARHSRDRADGPRPLHRGARAAQRIGGADPPERGVRPGGAAGRGTGARRGERRTEAER